MKHLLLAAALFGCLTSAAETPWKPAGDRIKTRWAAEVDPAAPLPEYPRPTLVRSRWRNLNGLWNYSLTPAGAAAPGEAQGRILVPFPIESSLSGVQRGVTPQEALWYETTFEVPAAWRRGNDVLLHFGAVDWRAEVYVNDLLVGSHTGGYTPFSFDITPALSAKGVQKLTVKVTDSTDKGFQPHALSAYPQFSLTFPPGYDRLSKGIKPKRRTKNQEDTTMKKWLALLLAAMMALALVACGDTPANNDNDNKDNDTKTEEFARGSWDGNVYTNDSLNLTVTVPDGWKIATDEELAAIMGITIDSLTEQGVSEEFLKAQNTYEMMAQDPTNGSNVIVMAENLTVSVGGTSYDEEAYSNVIINTLPEESGYEFADPKTVTIGGRDYYLLQCTAGEGNLGQDFLFTRIGNHMVSVILSYSPVLVDNADMLAMLGIK